MNVVIADFIKISGKLNECIKKSLAKSLYDFATFGLVLGLIEGVNSL